MTGKLRSLVLAFLLVGSVFAGAVATVGPAAAQAGKMLAEDTLDVDDDTQAVQVLAVLDETGQYLR